MSEAARVVISYEAGGDGIYAETALNGRSYYGWGTTAAEARDRLRRNLAKAIENPIVVPEPEELSLSEFIGQGQV